MTAAWFSFTINEGFGALKRKQQKRKKVVDVRNLLRERKTTIIWKVTHG